MLLLLCSLSLADPGWLLLNPTLSDAQGSRQVEAVVVRGDRIVHVGAQPQDQEGLQVVDLEGKVLAPGLVDAHVHLSLTPSGEKIQPQGQVELALWRHHLGAYLGSGVTTVLDTGSVLRDAQALHALSLQGPSPDLHFLGPLVSPPGGYVSVVLPQYPPAATAQDVQEQLQAFAPLEPIGVKITFESGMLFEVWPLYSEEVSQALVDSGRPLYAHAISSEQATMALDLGAVGLVHPPSKPTPALLARLAQQQTPVITTLSVYDSLLWGVQPERMEDPSLQWLVPQAELEAALDPDWRARSALLIAEAILPDSRPWTQRMTARSFGWRRLLESQTQAAIDGVFALHEAGVPLVMGSDSGNWPVFLYEFHGPTSQREVQLLGEAGLSPEAVMRICTQNPAELLGLEQEIGLISEGYRADLLVLSADPLERVSAWQELEQVMRAGELRGPREWVELARQAP